MKDLVTHILSEHRGGPHESFLTTFLDEITKVEDRTVNGGAKPRIDGAGQAINKITSGPISAKACINFTLTSIALQTV